MPHTDEPDDEDWYENDADTADSVPCPECSNEIYADLDHCPRCGYWLTDADRQTRETGLFASGRVRLVAIVMLAIFVLGLMIGVLGM